MKNPIYIIIAVLLILGVIVGVVLTNNDSASGPENVDSELTTDTASENDNLTPEEVIAQMDLAENVLIADGASVSITSPEGESFSIGQARMWQAEIAGIESGSPKVLCSWDFYVNDTLYKQMEITSSASPDDPTTCGFTSTFIDVAGSLKVLLNVELSDMYDTNLGSLTTSREYQVR